LHCLSRFFSSLQRFTSRHREASPHDPPFLHPRRSRSLSASRSGSFFPAANHVKTTSMVRANSPPFFGLTGFSSSQDVSPHGFWPVPREFSLPSPGSSSSAIKPHSIFLLPGLDIGILNLFFRLLLDTSRETIAPIPRRHRSGPHFFFGFTHSISFCCCLHKQKLGRTSPSCTPKTPFPPTDSFERPLFSSRQDRPPTYIADGFSLYLVSFVLPFKLSFQSKPRLPPPLTLSLQAKESFLFTFCTAACFFFIFCFRDTFRSARLLAFGFSVVPLTPAPTSTSPLANLFGLQFELFHPWCLLPVPMCFTGASLPTAPPLSSFGPPLAFWRTFPPARVVHLNFCDLILPSPEFSDSAGLLTISSSPRHLLLFMIPDVLFFAPVLLFF